VKLALAAALVVLAVAQGAAADFTPGSPTLPVVSPDGTQIAWVGGLSWKIWEAAPDGSGAHVIAPAPTDEGISDMHWTNQGLVVDSNFTLYLIRPGAKAKLISGLNGGFDFAVGGTRVATGFERGPGKYTVADLVSGKRWSYGSAETPNHFGTLSPDGTRVAW
jgi:WD40-like Beta Propeller Repeat